MINLCTKFEVPTFISDGNTKGNAKYVGDLGD